MRHRPRLWHCGQVGRGAQPGTAGARPPGAPGARRGQLVQHRGDLQPAGPADPAVQVAQAFPDVGGVPDHVHRPVRVAGGDQLGQHSGVGDLPGVPGNFLLVATVDPFGYPPDVDPTRFLLIAPYTNNPDQWTQTEWRNRYDPDAPNYRITTDKTAPPEPRLAVVRSYGDVLHDYRMHPEHKFLGPDHQPCQRATRGVLHRRPVHLLTPPTLIGKEANNLDDVTAGLVTTLDQVLTDYTNPHNDNFRELVWPVLARYSGRHLAALVRADRRTIDRTAKAKNPAPNSPRTSATSPSTSPAPTLPRPGSSRKINTSSRPRSNLPDSWRSGIPSAQSPLLLAAETADGVDPRR